MKAILFGSIGTLVETSEIREELLDLAPNREGDFFRVPKILPD